MIYLGKLLEKDDLHVFIYSGATLVDPYSITYTMFDCTQGKQEIIRQTINSKPMKFDTGSYFVPIKLDPKVFRIGRHLIRWSVMEIAGGSVQQATNDFAITRPPYFSGEFCNMKYPSSTMAYK